MVTFFTYDTLGIFSFLLISLCFFIKKIWLYGIAILLILAISFLFGILISDFKSYTTNFFLVSSLAIYGFGLLLIRIMLHRSISLFLLLNYKSSRRRSDINEHLNRRLDDLLQYHLAVKKSTYYHLTPFGRLISIIMNLFMDRASNHE